MMKLFCITYAGGNANFFSGLSSNLKGIETISIDYAGHGKRRAEPLDASMADMVYDIAEKINSQIDDESIALFGYSMGSIVAYEILERGLLKKKPVYFFAAAHYAPSEADSRTYISNMSDRELLQHLSAFGGVDKAFLENERFWPVFLPYTRNDHKLLEEYVFNKNANKLDIPLSVFYSEQDTPFQYIKGWRDVTTEKISFCEYTGTHFFLKNYENEIAKYIYNVLQPWAK